METDYSHILVYHLVPNRGEKKATVKRIFSNELRIWKDVLIWFYCHAVGWQERMLRNTHCHISSVHYYFYILLLCFSSWWSACAMEVQKMWFHTEVQHGIVWCDLFLLVIQAHLRKMCNSAKPELTGNTHEYLSCLWFVFFYFMPHNIAAYQISGGDGVVGRKM